LSQTEISCIDAYTLEAFYEGLPRDYRTELRAEGYVNFANACTKVITIQKRLEREESRYRNNRQPRDDSAPGGARGPVGNLPREAPGSLSAAPATNQPAAPNAFDGARKVCTFCKNYGHLFHECRKRQYRLNNPNINNNNNASNNCVPTTPQMGNCFEASASGTARGQGSVRPVLQLECVPEDCTLSGCIPATYLSSNFDQPPSEDL
ncbi:hypothetical protein ALC62_03888, partial [Cyphomyrmex costatus]